MTDALRPPSSSASETRATVTPVRYDFADAEKESFRSLAGSMSFVGVCLMLFGGLVAGFAVVALYGGFPGAALGFAAIAAAYAPAGWWTAAAGRSLSGIARTRGGDLGHLMEAVQPLRMLFAFARALIILQTLLLTALAGAFVWCTILADKGTRCLNLFG
ncbi:MAG: hypothetical protein ABSC94_18410 [Polyangiaceae bacterium]|jgi:hypothetical protein